jgi:hypothetical protein
LINQCQFLLERCILWHELLLIAPKYLLENQIPLEVKVRHMKLDFSKSF